MGVFTLHKSFFLKALNKVINFPDLIVTYNICVLVLIHWKKGIAQIKLLSASSFLSTCNLLLLKFTRSKKP
jgi:hypothetical protein